MVRSSFSRRQPPARTIPEVLRRWGAGLRPRIDLDHPSIFETAQDLAETLLDQPDDIAGALDRFGRRMGNEGWTLGDVAEWIDGLAEAASIWNSVVEQVRRDDLALGTRFDEPRLHLRANTLVLAARRASGKC